MKKAIKLPVLHKNRNELHALYVERLTSNVQKERQDSFKRLIEALEPCKREEVDCIEQVMSETNFENLLENASAYFEAEMPLHSNTLKIQKLPSIFEDCLTLYLTAVSFMSPPHQMHFYSNMSRLLAKKGYYYQDAPIKNTGHPIDALDYGLLALPYDSPDLLPYYQAGVAQITAEYYYHQGAALLQSTKLAIQSCHFKQDAKDTDIEIAIELFLKQFSLLLKVVKKYAEYPLAEMCALEQQCCDCLNSPELLEGLKKSFRFKLKYCKSDSELLKNTCEPFWVLLGAWGQYALSNAKTALHEFNKCLNAKLSQNPFSALAKEKTNELLLQLEKNELYRRT